MDSVALIMSRAHFIVQIASAKTQRDCTKMRHIHHIFPMHYGLVCQLDLSESKREEPTQLHLPQEDSK